MAFPDVIYPLSSIYRRATSYMHSPEELPVGMPSELLVPLAPVDPTGALPTLAAGLVLPPVGALDDRTSGGEPGGPGTAVAGTGPLGVATTAVGGDPGGPVTIVTAAEPGVATATGMGGEPGGPATAAIGAEPGGPATTMTGTALRVVGTPGVDVGPCELLGTPATEFFLIKPGPEFSSEST
jgi:hypothetical protein